MSKARKSRGYSDETAAKVKAAFDEIDARGDVVMPGEIARMIGMSKGAVQNVLRDAPYWTSDCKHEARRESGTRNSAALHKYLTEQESLGWPNLRRGNETLAAQGWPNLKKGHVTQAKHGWMNLRKHIDDQREADWPDIHKAYHIQYDQGRLGTTTAARLARGRLLPASHRLVTSGKRALLRIYTTLVSWRDTDNSPRGKRSTRAISHVVGLGRTSTEKYLRRLRADGLIDATNHVIAPWPDFDTPTPTGVDDTSDTHERAEGE